MPKSTFMNQVSNAGALRVDQMTPYICEVEIEGVAPLIFHAWNCDEVEAKANAPKNSKAKKTDNLESYVYRNPAGDICLPGTYLRGAIINAAKFKQDPRSPRKSAMDLVKAGVVILTDLASLGKATWDYLDRRRAVVQRNAITRILPAFLPGWRAIFQCEVLLPEYIDRPLLNELIQNAGRLIGVAEYRPTYGRFQVIRFS